MTVDRIEMLHWVAFHWVALSRFNPYRTISAWLIARPRYRLDRFQVELRVHKRGAAAWCQPIAFAVLALLLLNGCNKPADSSPQGAISEMIRATLSGNVTRAYELLAPSSQRELERMARRATEQNGGARKIAPHELLASSLDPVQFELSQPILLAQTLRSARVKLLARGPQRREEIIDLVRVGDRWRIVLCIDACRNPAVSPNHATDR